MCAHAYNVRNWRHQDELVAINMLNGCKVQRCDKHHFRDKMTVRT